jgi:hypothetical protein
MRESRQTPQGSRSQASIAAFAGMTQGTIVIANRYKRAMAARELYVKFTLDAQGQLLLISFKESGQ